VSIIVRLPLEISGQHHPVGHLQFEEQEQEQEQERQICLSKRTSRWKF
jgi:hypothetical protein